MTARRSALSLAFAAGCTTEPAGEDPASSTEGAETSDDALPSDDTTASPTTPGMAPTDDGTLGGSDGGSDGSDATDSSAGSTGAEVPDGVPVFVAQGHMGRTTISCDGGQTWIAEQSLDDTVRCFDGIDCDHHEGSATGIGFGGGAFVATWGWGTEGNIRRSTNGVDWEIALTGPTFAGTAFGNDVFVAGAPTPQRSLDFGAQWTELAPSTIDTYTPRGIGFVAAGGGSFVLAGGGSGDGDVVLSADAGDSWWHPDTLPVPCGDGVRGIHGKGELVVLARSGGADGPEVCVSSDGGHVWNVVDLGDVYLESRMILADDTFMIWSAGERWSSTDGAQWSSTPTEPAITIGAVGRDDEGHFVAVRGGWQVWYESQEFYRSDDGITWDVLQPGTFVGSHPVNHIAFGRVDAATSACP